MKKKINKTYLLEESPLFRLASRPKLADLLHVKQGDLRRILKKPEYKVYYLKQGEKKRKIEEPKYQLKKIQKRLAILLMRIEQPNYLFCPVKGRFYMQAAKEHCGNRVIRSLDIKKFYPSTDSKRVFRFFNIVMQCPRDIAGLLTKLCCYDGHLPTGASSSPILALLAYKEMWQEISDFCQNNNFTLSIYVDDIVVSGEKISCQKIYEIKKIIKKYNLTYHKEKLAIDRPREVLGMIIKPDGKLGLPNRILKKISKARKDGAEKGREILQNFQPMIKQLEAINA